MSAQVVKQNVFMCASVECSRHELLLHHHHCQSNCYHLSLSLEINYYVSVLTDVANLCLMYCQVRFSLLSCVLVCY